tara:strand:- start:1115 stop:1240 length:126 start_codon:yes stop_codon:yes gene_type:complete
MDKPKQLSVATLRAMAKNGIGHGKLIEVVKNLKKTNKKSAK